MIAAAGPGGFDLPANPVATRGAVDRISAAIEAVPQVDSPDEVQRRAVAATIAAAVAGQPIPVAEGIEAARVAERQRADQLATLHAGRETAALEVVHQISAAPSEIIEQHLRPAFDGHEGAGAGRGGVCTARRYARCRSA